MRGSWHPRSCARESVERSVSCRPRLRPAYGAALVTSYGRLRDGKHFLSDVVVGAAIGTATGYSVVNYNRKLRYGESPTESRATRLQLAPIFDRGTYGLTGSLSF